MAEKRKCEKNRIKMRLPEDKVVLLTCTDGGIQWAKKHQLPVIAFRDEELEKQIGGQSLFGAPVLCEDPEDIEDELIQKVWSRFHRIPWKIGKTERCEIREIGLADIDTLYELTGGEVNGQSLKPLHLSREEYTAYWESYIKEMYPLYDYGMYLILQQGKMIGMAGFQNPDYTGARKNPANEAGEHFELETGYWLIPEARGQGLAREVVSFLLDYAGRTWQPETFTAYICPDNEASRRLAQAVGMICVGMVTLKAEQVEKWIRKDLSMKVRNHNVTMV